MFNKNKKIIILAVTTLAAASLVGCSKKEPIKESETQKVEELKTDTQPTVLHVKDASFKSLAELKSFQKTSTSDFAKFLNTNNIQTVITEDGSLAINQKMTYEKYTKNFNQLAYTHITNDYENGIGYLKTGIKLNFHLEESISTNNNYVKAIFSIVNKHNPSVTEEAFNKQLLDATSDASNTGDVQFDIGVDGMTLNLNTLAESKERALVFTVRQKLDFPKQNQVLKEYKTVKDFKEDSLAMVEDVTNSIETLNTNIQNEYTGKAKNVSMTLKNIEYNDSDAFSQSIELEHKANKITSIPLKAIEGIYKTLHTLFGESAFKDISSNDLKAYFKSLEVYNGFHTTGTPVDEEGNILEINKLPIPSNVISIESSFEIYSDEDADTSNDNTKNSEDADENEPLIRAYNYNIKIKATTPVKAEGITKL